MFIWIFLRLIGVIETQSWLKVLPLITIGIAVISIVYKAEDFAGKLQRDLQFLKRNAIQTNKKLDKLDHDFPSHMKKHHT